LYLLATALAGELAFSLHSADDGLLNGDVGEHQSHVLLLDESIFVEVVPKGQYVIIANIKSYNWEGASTESSYQIGFNNLGPPLSSPILSILNLLRLGS
jgi:hypothetical protein